MSEAIEHLHVISTPDSRGWTLTWTVTIHRVPQPSPLRPKWAVRAHAKIPSSGAVATIGADEDPLNSLSQARDRAERLVQVISGRRRDEKWVIIRGDGMAVPMDGCWREQKHLGGGEDDPPCPADGSRTSPKVPPGPSRLGERPPA